jgi:hypothetical protein
MTHLLPIVLMASTALIGLSGSAFAGTIAVPEPTTLAVLAVGFGGIAAVKFLRGK